MQNNSKIVVLGTGGTIAGMASSADSPLRYQAAQIPVQVMVQGVSAGAGPSLEVEQVAQLDSKDMSHDVWCDLARSAYRHLQREEVSGLVITHGTDTLEETAWFLHRVLQPCKPVVLTAAMRPANDLAADGPQNLRDALKLAAMGHIRGVLAVMAGRVHAAAEVRKVHGFQMDAFSSGEAGPVALVRGDELVCLRPWEGLAARRCWPGADLPWPEPAQWEHCLAQGARHWPRVCIVSSHAGCDGEVLRAVISRGVDGVIFEGTGNGTVHSALLGVLAEAATGCGVVAWRATRCQMSATAGAVRTEAGEPAALAGDLTPAKARVELLLQLLAQKLNANGVGAPELSTAKAQC